MAEFADALHSKYPVAGTIQRYERRRLLKVGLVEAVSILALIGLIAGRFGGVKAAIPQLSPETVSP